MKKILTTISVSAVALLLAGCGNDLSRGGAESLINEGLASENKEVTEIIGITSGADDPENTRVVEFQWRLAGADAAIWADGKADFRLYDDGWRVTELIAVEPAMVKVPAGEYMMGSPDSEEVRYDNEGPVHLVKIAKPFAVGVYEVTFAEWGACVVDGGCNGYRPNNSGRGDLPVINVSWKDAQSYVQWIRKKTGKEYCLLSEAEWEYVARAGTTTAYSTGNTISEEQANYALTAC